MDSRSGPFLIPHLSLVVLPGVDEGLLLFDDRGVLDVQLDDCRSGRSSEAVVGRADVDAGVVAGHGREGDAQAAERVLATTGQGALL